MANGPLWMILSRLEMNDDLIKQLIKVKQVYETPYGSKFNSELEAIAHIKRQLQSTPQNVKIRTNPTIF